MSRFTNFLEKSLREDAESVPAYSDNASFGNTGNKASRLSTPVKTGVKTSDEDEDASVQNLIDNNDISIDVDTVKTIIALVEKGINDWNREKKLDSKELKTVILQAFDSGLIGIK